MVTGSLGDGAGGLASAVRAWSEALAGQGAEVTVFCLDLAGTFGPMRAPAPHLVRTVEVPSLIEPRTRLILAPRLQRELDAHVRAHGTNVIHANGVWLPGTRIAARVARKHALPHIVSPHGHLQAWAMAYRSWKKRFAWALYGKRSLQSAAAIQVASDREGADVAALGIRTPRALVPNVVAMPPERAGDKGNEGETRTVLFMSRIHPSKGLLDLVQAWASVRPKGWRAVIAGPDEVGHLADVRAAVTEAGLQDAFEFVGPVSYASRWSWYRAADLFVLPTYSENFGVTVAEAMAAGVPAITTQAAPWEALVSRRCGWWIPTGTAALESALREAVSMTNDERCAMGMRGRELVRERYSADAVAARLLGLYRWTRGEGAPPAFLDPA